MNYLSHFYVHQKDEDPMYSLGLIFPDISRGFVKVPGKLNKDEYLSFIPLAQGCLQHYMADKQFHSSHFFKWGSQVCTEILKDAPFEGEVNRRWFMGHVLFEMLLDRIIVNHQPMVAEHFYQELSAISLARLKDFVILHPHQDIEKFLHIFHHFRSAAYIKNYPDNNIFAFSLSRIMKKAGLPELSLSNKIVLQECVWELENNDFKNVQSVLFQLKEVFN